MPVEKERFMSENEAFGIILMTHGKMAEGMLDGANMIFGRPDGVVALGLHDGMSPADYTEKLEQALESFPQGALLLVDLFGGTPCNVAMMQARKQGRVLPVAAGLNMAMLLTVLNARERVPLGEIVAEAVKGGNKGVVDVSEKLAEIFASIDE